MVIELNSVFIYLICQLLNELTEEIVSFKPVEDVKVTDARILMIGPVGAGKSSFYNTIDSIFRGRITHRACSGSADQSLTTAVRAILRLNVSIHSMKNELFIFYLGYFFALNECYLEQQTVTIKNNKINESG